MTTDAKLQLLHLALTALGQPKGCEHAIFEDISLITTVRGFDYCWQCVATGRKLADLAYQFDVEGPR